VIEEHLKSAKQTGAKDLSTLDIWDDQLVAFGAELIAARLELIGKLKPLLQNFYNHLSQKNEEITIELKSSITSGVEEEEFESLVGATLEEITSSFYDRLQELRHKELDRGLTLAGPHRDELFFAKNDLAAKTHASQGEAWSLALGAKLASAELLREISLTADPVIILDDVFSVLDSGRRERLIEFAKTFEQVLITSTTDQGLPEISWSAKHQIVAGEVKS
jgi:DNA replication and repair protein RecF